MSATTSLSVRLSVGNVDVPANGFWVSSGTYGSIGHAVVETSAKILRERGIDLVDLGGGGPQIPVLVTVYADTGQGVVFGGEFTSSEWNFASDVVQIHARDWAGVLVDQKRVLARDVPLITSALQPLAPGQSLQASGVSTMNKKVSQVVTDIAQDFGFKPQISMVDGTDVLAGSIYGSTDHVFMTIPQNLWSVLTTLARETGNEVYTTTDRRLVFGEPGAGLDTLRLSWNTPLLVQPGPTGPSPVLPCDDLRISHNPRRNSTFRVLVISYDPGRATTVLGRATYIGDAPTVGSLAPGLHSGADAIAADKSLASAAANKQTGQASDLGRVQLYTFHWDGLTQDAATARAAAIATDITKRLMTLSCRIDGYPALVPTTPMTVQSADVPPAMTSNTWFVVGYRHVFRLPGGRGRAGRGSGGFWTEIQALDVPSTSLAAGGVGR